MTNEKLEEFKCAFSDEKHFVIKRIRKFSIFMPNALKLHLLNRHAIS